jgi:gluconokinase
MGVSGGGKTTLAQRLAARLGWAFAEGDEFHPASNIELMRTGHPLGDEERWPWLQAVARWIGEQEAAGSNAVVTCSALRRAYRDLLRDGHPSVVFVQLNAPAGVLADRLANRRHHYMPPTLLTSQLTTLEPLQPDEPGFIVDATGPPDAVTDLVLARLAALRPAAVPPSATPPVAPC